MDAYGEWLRQGSDDAFRDNFSVDVVLKAMQQNRELVTTMTCDGPLGAISGDHIRLPQTAFQFFGNAAKEQVASVVTQTVIYKFEVIEIQEQDGGEAKGCLIQMQDSVQLFFEQKSIW